MRHFDVTAHGAPGDGRGLAHAGINAAIRAARQAGGGMVVVPPGRYLCFSIRLASGVRLHLAQGAVIEAADPALHGGAYDAPEDNGEQLYQDFGHSHWHNSLIWGEDLHDVAITGPGRIEGYGLTRNGPGSRWRAQAGERPLSMQGMSAAQVAVLEQDHAAMVGLGNKAIALRACRHVELSGFTIAMGGHIAVLATGCHDMVLRDLSIDTQRDGIDLDCVQRCLVEGCRVNSPNDDAIVVKTSLALGAALPAQDITIRHCTVSGYDPGTMLDGTHGTGQTHAPDRDRVTGRIKIGTETNGDIRRILIEDCRFERSRGLAIESVDGAVVEEITARRLTMEAVTSAPFFLRLGARLRGPTGTRVGAMRHITLEAITARGIDRHYPAAIAGLPGHGVEHVTLRAIDLTYEGGGTPQDARANPPELADAYPEPSMFGTLPAWALWLRHVRGVTITDVHARHLAAEARPALVAQDARALCVTASPVFDLTEGSDPCVA
jgi:polygalacturonase